MEEQMKLKLKSILVMVIIGGMCISVLSGCGKNTTNGSGKAIPTPTPTQDSEKSPDTAAEHVKVQIVMEDGGTMVFELYPEYAPKTVANFVKLVKEGFYDGLTFHRIKKNFMIQGGDPEGNGSGGSDETIKGEFSANGFTQNTLSHTYGVISMARGKSYDSASSQFFIMNTDYPGLDGKYAAFGKLIEGSDTLDAISNTTVETDAYGEKSKPVEDVVIKSIKVIE
jgi:peptidylprolyl isomerase/peptidyl-prolyl cis-trans isomerase B (cyclophilin B)